MSIVAALPAIASAASSIWNSISGKNEARHQERLQREFAQNQIQWKVADAKKAGIHPLYALGAPTMSYSPVSVGGGLEMPDMGQDISRAMNAGMPKEGQLSSFDAAVQDLQLKKFGLENELLAAQIRRLNTEVLSKPALPITLPGGSKFDTGNQSSAQTVQDRYGDIVENIYGIGSLGYDAVLNMKQVGDAFRARNPSRYRSDGLLRNPRNVDPRKRWLEQRR